MALPSAGERGRDRGACQDWGTTWDARTPAETVKNRAARPSVEQRPCRPPRPTPLPTSSRRSSRKPRARRPPSPTSSGTCSTRPWARRARSPRRSRSFPGQLLQQLKQAVDPPDWFSILAFALLKVSQLDPHLHVGALDPGDNWSRALTLTYSEPPDSLTIGLALTDADKTHGIIVKANLQVPLHFGAGGLTVSFEAQGDGEWRIPFGGAMGPRKPNAAISLAATYDPNIHLSESGVVFGVGPARVLAHLAAPPVTPLWTLEVGLGNAAGTPGIEAGVDLGQALGLLAAIIHIEPIDEKYSPKLNLAPGSRPVFTLGNAG